MLLHTYHGDAKKCCYTATFAALVGDTGGSQTVVLHAQMKAVGIIELKAPVDVH